MTDARERVRAEVMEGIGLVTFDAPTRNVATAETWQSLADAIARYAADDGVRVLVLTGAGHHAFVSDPDAADVEAQIAYDAAAAAARQALAEFGKPSIVRVRGECMGAGLVMALHADIVIAAADSAFALPGARWGACYPPDVVAALARQVGPQQARRLLFTGGKIEAQEALQIGLVTAVVADEDLSDAVVELARTIADNAPLAVAAAKRMVAAPGDPALGGLVDACTHSEDHRDGLAARRGGKTPVFHGR